MRREKGTFLFKGTFGFYYSNFHCSTQEIRTFLTYELGKLYLFSHYPIIGLDLTDYSYEKIYLK